LEKLKLCISGRNDPVLDNALFNGDFSSVREMSLSGLITSLPWKNLANLRVLYLETHMSGHSVNQLLDIFEAAPQLQTVDFENLLPNLSKPPAGRMVSLPHLKTLAVRVDPIYPPILNHLDIPTGASLELWDYGADESSFQVYVPEKLPNLRNVSCVTSINLLFDSFYRYMRLSGPNGNLRLRAHWEDGEDDEMSDVTDYRILRSLSPPTLSKTERLTISGYKHPVPAVTEECPVLRALHFSSSLRTLILIKCNNLPFILALDPEENPSKSLFCPRLEELHLYVGRQDQFYTEQLTKMVENRASRGAKFSSITITGLRGSAPGEEVSKLREYVGSVECGAGNSPGWDIILGEGGDDDGDGDGDDYDDYDDDDDDDDDED
jgi:hypothetical protein